MRHNYKPGDVVYIYRNSYRHPVAKIVVDVFKATEYHRASSAYCPESIEPGDTVVSCRYQDSEWVTWEKLKNCSKSFQKKYGQKPIAPVRVIPNIVMAMA